MNRVSPATKERKRRDIKLVMENLYHVANAVEWDEQDRAFPSFTEFLPELPSGRILTYKGLSNGSKAEWPSLPLHRRLSEEDKKREEKLKKSIERYGTKRKNKCRPN